jgi:hypothetical protein
MCEWMCEGQLSTTLPVVRVRCLFSFCKRSRPTNSLLFLSLFADRLVAKITGVLPLTPRNFKGEPKIEEWETYDVRYHSFSTMGKFLDGEGRRRVFRISKAVPIYGHIFFSLQSCPQEETCTTLNSIKSLTFPRHFLFPQA